MTDATAAIDCPVCGDNLDVPIVIVSEKPSASNPGHVLVTVEADPAFLAAHQAARHA